MGDASSLRVSRSMSGMPEGQLMCDVQVTAAEAVVAVSRTDNRCKIEVTHSWQLMQAGNAYTAVSIIFIN
jgi:hypothetical protein